MERSLRAGSGSCEKSNRRTRKIGKQNHFHIAWLGGGEMGLRDQCCVYLNKLLLNSNAEFHFVFKANAKIVGVIRLLS